MLNWKTSMAIVALAGALYGCQPPADQTVTPETLKKIGAISPRFQSYNVEMIEVTGGKFWRPYASTAEKKPDGAKSDGPIEGLDPNLYEYRQPIDLSNPRLRMLAAALGPAYMRVSGTWANATYLPEEGEEIVLKPDGYDGILTRQQWQGVVEFSKAVDAEITTSFAVSTGTRGTDKVWKSDQAQRLVNLTKSLGGQIAAAEFMNEPNFVDLTKAPEGYSAADYGRDFDIFQKWIKAASPETLVLGPGSVGESGITPFMLWLTGVNVADSADMLSSSKQTVDGFSYHHYGALSRRCRESGFGSTDYDSAFTEDWLSRTDDSAETYEELRDEYAKGANMWLTETGEAACGGNPWAATFADSFRYLDQMGRLAKRGTYVVMHNTLAASDYALLEETDFAPRPSYWAALLWTKLMGTTVLGAGTSQSDHVKLYAHCHKDIKGGVTLLAINIDRENSHDLALSQGGMRYTLTAPKIDGKVVRLNGETLALQDETLPVFKPVQMADSTLALGPASISFVAFPNAGNQQCK